MVCRPEALSKIAEKHYLNCMGNSAIFEDFGLRGLQKITRAAGGLLQSYELGIRDSVSRSNTIQKADRECTRRV